LGFRIKTRYGATETFEDTAQAERVVDRLITELATEEFEEPDDEHTQVVVGYKDWSVTAQVSGLLRLSNLSGITGSPTDRAPEELFMRATSKSQVADLLLKTALGRIDEVRAAGWLPFEKVGPHQADLFRTQETNLAASNAKGSDALIWLDGHMVESLDTPDEAFDWVFMLKPGDWPLLEDLWNARSPKWREGCAYILGSGPVAPAQ
jgi:hypothetical protein